MNLPEESSKPAGKISIRVVGVGGAGCQAAAQIARQNLAGVGVVGINTDAVALDVCDLPEKILLACKATRGLGTGSDPDLGKAAAEAESDRLREACRGAEIVFVIAGMGGGTGGGAGPVVARLAKETAALVFGVATMPFPFEGRRRMQQAEITLDQFQLAADAVICLPNEKLSQFIDDKTSVAETFQISNRLLGEGVHGIWRMLTQPGLIQVDFSSLTALIGGTHGQSRVASVDASGEGRVQSIIDQLLAHPMLDGGDFLGRSAQLLVSLTGGPDFSMSELQRLMEQIMRLSEKANVVMGAAIDPDSAGRIGVTLIGCLDERQQARELTDSSLHAEISAASHAEIRPEFLGDTPGRPHSRFVAPAPELPQEKKERIYSQQSGGRRRKKSGNGQGQLPLEIISKGRFEKSEPTLHRGEDLDVPTYIRRGIALN